MSLFNMVVKPHPLAPWMLLSIDWSKYSDNPNKYPLLGRLRYVWLDEQHNIKLLLKDGPSSWSEQQDDIMNQIKTHESFINVVVYEKDPVYIIATFKPIHDSEIFEDFESIENALSEKGIPSMLKDPFDIFNEELEKMKNGAISDELKAFGERLKEQIEKF